jgi:hypothetical protein
MEIFRKADIHLNEVISFLLGGHRICVRQFDQDVAAWYLQKYPLDLIEWYVNNSNRKDIVLMPKNYGNQTILEMLRADELSISRHNSNRFDFF